MSDEERKTSQFCFGTGIKDMPIFMAPQRTRSQSNVSDVKPSHVVVSSPIFESNSREVETRTNNTQIEEAVSERAHKERYFRMRETQAQLENYEKLLSQTMKQKELLAQQNEILSKKIEEAPTSGYQYMTPTKPGRCQKNRQAAMIRGSPVDKHAYNEDPTSYDATGLYDQHGNPIWGVPKNKDMKLPLAKFAAKETYKGLGTGVDEWVERFIRQLEHAQSNSGCFWDEGTKMDVLENHLEGNALEFWQIKRKTWPTQV
jgi:hypothetical protein